ncbi:hypothetical protein N7448_009718 [Penicillium atrosanguineum]|nr:hypothetical protein N7448_009718 [Penicillium atrosanguineum]
MGRPSDSDIPLRSIDDSDRPPLYDDVTDVPSSTPVETSIPGGREGTTFNNIHGKGGTFTLSPSLSKCPSALYRLISSQAEMPPRQYIHIKGCKSKGEEPWEFNFTLDLTPTLLQLGEGRKEWHELLLHHVGHDGAPHFDRSVMWAPGWEESSRRRNSHEAADLEEGTGEPEDHTLLGADADRSNKSTPGLMDWCERFCRDPARVKSFTLTRELIGFDIEPMRTELTAYLRALNYGGYIEITTSIPNSFVTIYTPHWINYLRTSTFVFWVLALTQLWIITAFVLGCLDQPYHVVSSVWRSSRELGDPNVFSRKVYAHGRDETKLADFWAPTVAQAFLDRRNDGFMLREESLQHLHQRAQERRDHIQSFLPQLNVLGGPPES